MDATLVLPVIVILVVVGGMWLYDRHRKKQRQLRHRAEESAQPEVFDRRMLAPRTRDYDPAGWGDDSTPSPSTGRPRPTTRDTRPAPSAPRPAPPPAPPITDTGAPVVLDRAFLEARQRRQDPPPSDDA